MYLSGPHLCARTQAGGSLAGSHANTLQPQINKTEDSGRYAVISFWSPCSQAEDFSSGGRRESSVNLKRVDR